MPRVRCPDSDLVLGSTCQGHHTAPAGSSWLLLSAQHWSCTPTLCHSGCSTPPASCAFFLTKFHTCELLPLNLHSHTFPGQTVHGVPQVGTSTELHLDSSSIHSECWGHASCPGHMWFKQMTECPSERRSFWREREWMGDGQDKMTQEQGVCPSLSCLHLMTIWSNSCRRLVVL
jgi:hypothetical protein